MTTEGQICAVYVALYRREEEETSAPSSFHWALCYLPRSDDDPTHGFYVYQVIDDNGAWEYSKETNPHHVERNKRFHIVVKLGYVSADINALAEFTESQPATQEDTPLLSTHRKWSCALWIIRVLSDLQEAGLFMDIPLATDADKAKFYRRIYSIGALTSADPNSYFPVVYHGNVKMTHYK
ncbi:hypothetical protein F5880DRAFT_1492553 [Lentinula raphanica]|nr:hypothetical protein F5880DRAFT_1492553 [Lentinula raphanica]